MAAACLNDEIAALELLSLADNHIGRDGLEARSLVTRYRSKSVQRRSRPWQRSKGAKTVLGSALA